MIFDVGSSDQTIIWIALSWLTCNVLRSNFQSHI